MTLSLGVPSVPCGGRHSAYAHNTQDDSSAHSGLGRTAACAQMLNISVADALHMTAVACRALLGPGCCCKCSAISAVLAASVPRLGCWDIKQQQCCVMCRLSQPYQMTQCLLPVAAAQLAPAVAPPLPPHPCHNHERLWDMISSHAVHACRLSACQAALFW